MPRDHALGVARFPTSPKSCHPRGAEIRRPTPSFPHIRLGDLDFGANPRIDSHQVRAEAYWAMLSGAAGHGYGALDLFYLYKDKDGPFPRDGFQHWRKALAYEGSTQVGLMRRLFELRPWHKMVPDQSILPGEAGDGVKRIQAARAEDGSFAIVYLPVGGAVSVHMDKIAGKKVKARWYDPRTGKWREIGEYANEGKREFEAPSKGDKDDWVLVLDDAEKGYTTERADRRGGSSPRWFA